MHHTPPDAMKKSCRQGYFHTSGPWPLLQGHPEGMKIRRGRRLGPTSALLGATKAPTHTSSVRQEPHRHPKLLCLREHEHQTLDRRGSSRQRPYFHISAWKENSEKLNFRFTEFSEVRIRLPGYRAGTMRVTCLPK